LIWEETGHEYACGDMLEPRESDIPVLFLVLVVLPLVAYILLRKWSETAKKRNRITLLAHLAAEEAFKVENVCCRCNSPSTSSVLFSFRK
jgi:ubiquitin carboxyl-terminal hydrolase 36/42